jgi:hypothetical protein
MKGFVMLYTLILRALSKIFLSIAVVTNRRGRMGKFSNWAAKKAVGISIIRVKRLM